ncbi:DNA primase [Actinomyces sp. zg-332]|uniref:DNA primase n=1 Tax=Actinomyces sp. zg-332 TaxID=2708340 RepID=UPI001421F939|nr:DNA primase [Actinomyces sp. zg-332]QPK93773.1 DNA primase [Actinomyces sp. zg-332]
MTKSRIALDELLEAFEKHYAIASNEDSSDDEILEAEDELLNAFFVYDDSLYLEHGVEIPIDLLADLFDEIGQDENYDENEIDSSSHYSDEEDEDYDLDDDI